MVNEDAIPPTPALSRSPATTGDQHSFTGEFKIHDVLLPVSVELDDATATSAAGLEPSVGFGRLGRRVSLGNSQGEFAGFGLFT